MCKLTPFTKGSLNSLSSHSLFPHCTFPGTITSGWKTELLVCDQIHLVPPVFYQSWLLNKEGKSHFLTLRAKILNHFPNIADFFNDHIRFLSTVLDCSKLSKFLYLWMAHPRGQRLADLPHSRRQE